MTGSQRIPIAERFWFELLKVQLPRIVEPGFFERHYEQPEEFDSLVKDAYFLQLVATNEHSGNFRTFLRFWARLLQDFRTSPRGAKPCAAPTVLSLSLLCRCLLKHFAETFKAPEFIFQLEQAPYEPSLLDGAPPLPEEDAVAGSDGATALPSAPLRLWVTYRGRSVPVPLEDAAGARGGSTVSAEECLVPFRELFPEDRHLLVAGRCALRAVVTGETFAAADLEERLAQIGAYDHEHLVVCPSGAPNHPKGTVRSVFREIADFLVSSSLGAASGESTSERAPGGAEPGDGDVLQRNVATSPHTMQLHGVLLEILLTLGAVIEPRYVAPDPERRAARRDDFMAPYYFGSNHGRPGTDETVVEDASLLSVPAPPLPGEMPVLPFLTTLQQVFAEDASEDAAIGLGIEGRMVAHGGKQDMPSTLPGKPAESNGRGASAGTNGCGGEGTCTNVRAQALLTFLLNCIWLEPHAASLPEPSRELLQLLGGMQLPKPGSKAALAAQEDFAVTGAFSKRAVSKAAVAAARCVAQRALLVLLLLLVYDSEAHEATGHAFAALRDPLLDGVHHGSVGPPLNFAQLLQVIMARLGETLYPLLFYCLIHRNEGFREYCLCRADADSVLVPMLEALAQFPVAPAGAGSHQLSAPPPSATALLLILLTLTGDKSLCEAASRTELADGTAVLGRSLRVQNIAVSSLIVASMLRIAAWNFSTTRDGFINEAVAGVLGNLAHHGVENLHWHAACRLLDRSQSLAKSMSKAEGGVNPEMRRCQLAALARLLSSCLQSSCVPKNCALVYALLRTFPSAFSGLESDADVGPRLRHIRAVVDWFAEQCPPEDSTAGDDWEGQMARLKAAARKLPQSLDAVAGEALGGFAYAEVPQGAARYFLPVTWREAGKLMPEHICWSRERARGGKEAAGASKDDGLVDATVLMALPMP